MTESLAVVLGTTGLVGTLAWIISLIYKECIKPLIFRKEPDEVSMLEQTIKEKQEELYTRNQIERLSKDIENLDEQLCREDNKSRDEPLNTVLDDEQIRRDAEAIKRGFGGLGVSTEDLGKHNKASADVIGPMQYLEKATAYAGGVVVEASTTYPALKTIGGDNMSEEKKEQTDEEYFEQVALKDQALRTIKTMIDSDKGASGMMKSMVKNGMSENGALLSVMEMMEENVKK